MRSILYRYVLLPVVLLLATVPAAYGVTPPRELAGFKLGQPLDQYRAKLDMNSVIPVRYRRYLAEVDVIPGPGYKSGYLVFGTCTESHPIVRIRMKYLDCSKKFYQELLDRFTKRFGDPDEYRGDPFQTFLAWKWRFRDAKGERVGLVLEHYTGQDDEYPHCTTVKLTLNSQIDRERACYLKKHPKLKREHRKNRAAAGKITDIERFVPK